MSEYITTVVDYPINIIASGGSNVNVTVNQLGIQGPAGNCNGTYGTLISGQLIDFGSI